GSGIPSHHWIVRQNTILNTHESGVIVTGTTYSNIYIYNNTLVNEAAGLFRVLDDFDGAGGLTFHLGSSYAGPIVVKNNIGYGVFNPAPLYADNPITWSGQLAMDYNLWMNTVSPAQPYYWAGSYLSLASFQATTGMEMHALTRDPLFTSLAG